MSTTTDRVMGGYGEAEHNKALGNLLADAKAMPAAEAMDWKAKCIISKSADGFWDVLSACRGWWWHDMAQKWFEQSPHTTCGAYGTRQDAEEALAACPTPYPNFIPSAIEAAREADIGDGLGLDHDQSRRTMGATLAKMPELARRVTNPYMALPGVDIREAPGQYDKRIDIDGLGFDVQVWAVRVREPETIGDDATGRYGLHATGEWYMTVGGFQDAVREMFKAIELPHIEIENC